eukprot:Partr_v1_DN27485_c1_g1_i2_m71875 putative phospholipase C
MASEMEALWTIADKDKDGKLSVDEIQRLLGKMNLEMPKAQVKSLVVDLTKGSKEILKPQFDELVKIISSNSQLKAVFSLVNGGPDTSMSAVKFLEFLKNVQRHSEKEAQDITSKFQHADKSITLEGFLEYFASEHAAIISPLHSGLHMDMTRPLNDYFIKSSHNTYLTGDQLKSNSSVDAYIRALRMGCRCVELDCWDGPNGQPIVYHGFTLTSKILFADIIKGVKENAFAASPYPVILSLEVHCGLVQQKVMAQIMNDVLGPMLVSAPLSMKDGQLPSPELLKHKIFVKGKAKPKAAEEELENDFDDDEAPDQPEESKKKQEKVEKHVVADELGALAIYMKSKKFKTFEAAFKDFTPAHVSSFVETKATALVKKSWSDLTKFNSQSFSRIYPKGGRVDSSNISPLEYWQAGAQLAALNYQTFDKGMQINSGFFDQNGKTGYLLKPSFQRNLGKMNESNLKVLVSVISAFRLPKAASNEKGEVIDPFVEVELNVPTFGAGGADLVSCEMQKTSVIDDNGFNPSWTKMADAKKLEDLPHLNSKKAFSFKLPVKCPELSFLRFVIKDHDMYVEFANNSRKY